MSHAECLAEPSDDDLPEIGIAAYEKNDGWRKALESSPIIDRSTLFAAAAADLYGEAYRETNSAAFHAIERDIEILGCDYADLPANPNGSTEDIRISGYLHDPWAGIA